MSGKVTAFTAIPLRWNPYLTPVDLAQATPEQLDAMQITPSHRRISAYVLTLAHDPQSLKARSPLFNAVMYGKDGLPAADRELGALAASVVNRCIYCAAVHAARHNHLTGGTAIVDAIFADGTQAELPEREQAIFDFGVGLSRTPPQVGAEDIERLRAQGLDGTDILDLILAVAIFGWANRLMHGLGEPIAA
jgi:uncharacterized peroxidase-related enzyme